MILFIEDIFSGSLCRLKAAGVEPTSGLTDVFTPMLRKIPCEYVSIDLRSELSMPERQKDLINKEIL
jgi:hypothetical protein